MLFNCFNRIAVYLMGIFHLKRAATQGCSQTVDKARPKTEGWAFLMLKMIALVEI